jgi:FKBP-type peptidyl-prolyl cis-trans isomerase SlpA
LTLRYRVCLTDGTEVVSTFDTRPATLSMGAGQLAETLERCLVGMSAGERRMFTLEPEAGFGVRNPELVQRIALSALPRPLEEEIGERVSFTDAGGAEFAGTVIDKSDRHATFDFNHPLAGRTVLFEAEIIGIL